uniref:FAS1 domain-containing protein n=1 Tax=Oxyrrhis marina TaxID=2969 RepID=A0A6U9JBK3_OXYMA
MRLSLPLVCFFQSWTAAADNIDKIITDSADHTTLETALTQAGLLATLGGAGPFTVIAPTDAAFTASLADLGAATTADLLAREDLAEILEYHVHPTAKVDPLEAGTIDTMQMMQATVTVEGAVTKVTGATEATISSKVDADNGVLHVSTDKILLPKPIATIATENGSFGVLLEALTKAGLAETFGLKNEGKLYTVFAPTDDAFNAYLKDKDISKEDLLNDANLGDKSPLQSRAAKENSLCTTVKTAAQAF